MHTYYIMRDGCSEQQTSSCRYKDSPNTYHRHIDMPWPVHRTCGTWIYHVWVHGTWRCHGTRRETWVHMSWKGTWNIDTPWKSRWHMDTPLNNTWNMVHVSWKGTWNIDIPWKSTWLVDMPWDDRYTGTAPSTSCYGCVRPSRSYLV